jgi:hypothetical protein
MPPALFGGYDTGEDGSKVATAEKALFDLIYSRGRKGKGCYHRLLRGPFDGPTYDGIMVKNPFLANVALPIEEVPLPPEGTSLDKPYDHYAL